MQPNPSSVKRISLIAASLMIPLTSARAEEPPLRDLLRDGLYTEEVTRDPEAAARQYEQVIARYSEQRAFAAAALFRLAEVRRKQDRKEDAVKLYQQLIVEFPAAVNETRLAREELVKLGAGVPAAGDPVIDKEAQELARLRSLAETSPDVLVDPRTLFKAVELGFEKVVAYLLSAGAKPFSEDNLVSAASSGNLAITRQLFATGVAVPEKEGWKALSAAVSNDRGALLEFLLHSGVKPDTKTLHDALDEGKWASAEMLLKHGADPNRMLTHPDGNSSSPALQQLISNGQFTAAGWLLDKGAKPDLPEDVNSQSPLFQLAKSRKEGCLHLMERLLKAGANANRTTRLPEPANRPQELRFQNSPPLAVAAESDFQSIEKIGLLLRYGADPNILGAEYPLLVEVLIKGNQEAAKLLVAAGADLKQPGSLRPFLEHPNEANLAALRFLLDHDVDASIPDGELKIDQTEYFSDPFLDVTGKVETYPFPQIHRIRYSEDNHPEIALEMTRLMLAAGAKAGPAVGLILGEVAKFDEKGDVFRSLLAQRPEKLILRGYPDQSNWKAIPRQIYLDEVLIPALAKQSGITLLDPETGIRKPFVEEGSNKEIPSTLELLRTQQDVLLGKEDARQWPNLQVVRVDADGALKRLPIDLGGDTALPELRKGDILEIRREGTQAPNRSEDSRAIQARYQWCLDKRVSFPISMEIDGKAREILVRGDLLAFDPTKGEVPLVNMGTMVSLLLPDPSEWPEFLTVKRPGWNDVRLPLKAGGGSAFRVQAGDRLVIERSKADASAQGATIPVPPGFSNRDKAVLVSPGLPFAKINYTEKVKQGTSLPTLVQTITDAYSPYLYWLGDKDAPRDAEALYPWLHEMERMAGQAWVPVILPHPDFSKIRIRRTGGDGTETIIAVDLTESIRACNDATTPESARKGDIQLQPGDIVELPVLEHPAGPWTGFSAAEVLFFRKVFSGRVVLNSGSGQVEQRVLHYSPPEWRVTSHGILPLPPVDGISTARLLSLVNWGTCRLTREGMDPFNAEGFTFVRDGDQIDALQRISPPRVTQPSR